MKFEKLENIAKVVSGSTPKTNIEKYWNGDIPWVTPKEISQLQSTYLNETERKLTREGFKSCSTSIIPKGNILFTSRAPIGLIAINNIDVCTNQGFKSLILKDGYSSLYVYYYLKSKVQQINNLGVGTTFKELSKSTFEKFEIPVTDYQSQLHIANILSKAENLIAQRKESIRLLDEYLKSVFLEMFGESSLNEKKWPKIELRNFGKISTGNTPSRKDSENYSPKYIEWIKTDNIQDNQMVITQASEYLSEIGLSKARKIDKGALLVACIAGSIESIGRACITNRTVAFNQQINAIQPNKDFEPLFLYWLFRINRKYIQNHATKGMKKILTKGEFECIEMIKPPRELQNKFAQIVKKNEALKAQYQQSLQELENLYGSLSQKAFKGELSIKDESLLMAAEPETKYYTLTPDLKEKD